MGNWQGKSCWWLGNLRQMIFNNQLHFLTILFSDSHNLLIPLSNSLPSLSLVIFIKYTAHHCLELSAFWLTWRKEKRLSMSQDRILLKLWRSRIFEVGVDQETLIVHRTMSEVLDLLLHMGGAPYCLLFFSLNVREKAIPKS